MGGVVSIVVAPMGLGLRRQLSLCGAFDGGPRMLQVLRAGQGHTLPSPSSAGNHATANSAWKLPRSQRVGVCDLRLEGLSITETDHERQQLSFIKREACADGVKQG
jgi:hypothetical protein